MADEVYSALRGMIIRRELAPGARITEGEIAAVLGVSRTPVREAFHRLAYDELLVDRPGRSPRVRPITLQSIDEAYPLIAVLEGLASRLACRRLTERDLAYMDELTGQMEQHARRGEIELLMKTDGSFHGVLHERAENMRLHDVVAELRRRVERLEYVFFSTPEAVKGSVKRHRWLVRVLRKHDPRAAEKALEYLWGVGQKSVRALVEDLGIVSNGSDEPQQALAAELPSATLSASAPSNSTTHRGVGVVVPRKSIQWGGVP